MSSELQELVLATRRSPLALAQARETAARITRLSGRPCRLLEIVTSGDKRLEWSLERQGGKGLFTSELEAALSRGEAHVAVHSCKDLPTTLGEGLVLAGCLPREDARDVLVLRAGVETPARIATSSPRRRSQLLQRWPEAQFTEIRGNVDTRLRKLAEGAADASVLASAGLNRLGIASWPCVEFRRLERAEMIPAAGQAAIALQTTLELEPMVSAWCDPVTTSEILLERAALAALGGGCHASVAAHVHGGRLLVFLEGIGRREIDLGGCDPRACVAEVGALLRAAGVLA
jgi:hydroxymethylbilane synthase